MMLHILAALLPEAETVENGRILHSFALAGGSASDGTRDASLTVPTIAQFPTGQLAFRPGEAKISFLDMWQASWKLPR